MVMQGNEVIVTKNGKEVGLLIPRDAVVSYLTDSLTGVPRGDHDLKKEKEEGLRKKYEIAD
jgi:antitoxin (DNA-binding transcriptional repressor) of toxin-antitoxin stability system